MLRELCIRSQNSKCDACFDWPLLYEKKMICTPLRCIIGFDFVVQVDLWFHSDENERPSSPEDPEDPYPYHRDNYLKKLFFKLFSDWEQVRRLDHVVRPAACER